MSRAKGSTRRRKPPLPRDPPLRQVCLVEPGAFPTGVVAAASTTTATSTGAITDYDGLREHARDALHRSLRNGADPRDLAARIVSIAQARSPRPRYGAGREALLIPHMTTLLPQRLVERLLRHSFGLPR